MKQNILVIATTLAFLFGCSSAITKYPKINIDDLSPAVVLAIPEKGRYLEPFEECQSEKTICLDPEPQAITYHIISQIYGDKLPNPIEVATTGHFGLQSFNFRKKAPEIIFIGTKDGHYILPRYHRIKSVEIKPGSYAIPVNQENMLWWLPCFASTLIQPIDFGSANSDLAIPLDEASEYLKKSPFAKLVNSSYIPTHGVYVKDLQNLLESTRPKTSEFKCGED